MIDALDIHVKGIVQGVGFRPFVYKLAKKYLINGWVLNAVDGVHIHAEGESEHVDAFVMELSENAPAAAQVAEIEMKEVPLEPFDSFEIRFSEDDSAETTFVSPDLATCDQCTCELFDESNRRYRYPFINCTNCGPRFTIIDHLPYDRPNTSMSKFAMCSACNLEYTTPTNRRFHAQPNACFECGPHISWSEDDGKNIRWGLTRKESDDIFERAIALLREGKILAVKGLGGFHLVCDANNADAVARLRERKHRYGKAFAVMVENVEAAKAYCHVSTEEAAVLTGATKPIVLLRKRGLESLGVSDGGSAAGQVGAEGNDCHSVNDVMKGVADGLPELGVMLPYTPVQLILMNDFAEAAVADDLPAALVMTSGNMHDEPICTNDNEAYERLAGIADAFLGNNREVLSRFDDSVVRIIKAGSGEAIQMIRRARGYAPTPIAFSAPGTSEFSDVVIFATGPEQKNTFTLMRLGNTGVAAAAEADVSKEPPAPIAEAFVSQHIGDMENADTFDAWLAAKDRLQKLFDLQPNQLACDLHPEYITTKWAHEQAALKHLSLDQVQHHHAHIASVMAECGLAPTSAVCGIAFDGTGYGADGNIWGGEVLMANMGDYERFANFAYVPMPGGSAAIKHPLQMAYGVLWEFDLLEHPGAKGALEKLGESQCATLDSMIEQGINTPVTSSVGRLFDAASALLGICIEPTYEGEPAIMLGAAMYEGGNGETACAGECNASSDQDEANAYAIGVIKNTATPDSTAHDTSVILFDAADLFRAMLDDVERGMSVSVISRRFHDAFVDAIVAAAQLSQAMYEISTIALSGGVFMNRYLIENAISRLEQAGFTVAINRELPPNDGCVSFGEAVVCLFQRREPLGE